MNWDSLKASWAQFRGGIRMRWGRLSDDQLNVIEGRREVLLGKLQETYGVSAAEAEQQVAEWERAQSPPDPDPAQEPLRKLG